MENRYPNTDQSLESQIPPLSPEDQARLEKLQKTSLEDLEEIRPVEANILATAWTFLW